MSKKNAEEFVDVEETAVATTAEDTAMAVRDCTGVDLTGVTPGDCGGMPWAKMDRKEGTITVNEMQLLAPDGAAAMLVVGNQAKTFVSYDSVKDPTTGKYVPRAKYENAEGKFASAEAEAIAAGETVPNADGSWPDNKAPTAVPAINLQVLIEDESGAIAINGRYFTRAMLALGKKDYYGVATRYFGGIQNFGRREGFAPYLMEFVLSVLDKDKYDNFWLQARLVKFHQPDSEFAQAARSVLG